MESIWCWVHFFFRNDGPGRSRYFVRSVGLSSLSRKLVAKMLHELMKPSDSHRCSRTFNIPYSCWLCDGGLACCKICGLAEIELDDHPECLGTRDNSIKDVLRQAEAALQQAEDALQAAETLQAAPKRKGKQ